ncbi:hypothetical protein [Ruania albidiflava]|uniref:hypothetical protein n=1 Tax=Ruania albidiflava TaxID=366586 RepID=UPI00041DF5D6|nr:hypothetical protein [Ruania albidiflava]
MKTLNPVALDEVPAPTSLREEIRSRIAADADSVRPDDVVPQPISRPTRRILAGAAAAVLLLVGVYTLSPQRTPEAYAGWSASATELAPAQLGAMADLCPPTQVPVGADESVEVTPILAEQRGDYKMRLAVSDVGYQWCFVMPDADADSGVRRGAEGMFWPEDQSPVPAGDGEVTLVQASSYAPFPDLGPLTMIVGTAGADVTEVQVATAGGSFADATVADGWWIVWFPGDVELGDTMTVTTSDGTQTEVAATPAAG